MSAKRKPIPRGEGPRITSPSAPKREGVSPARDAGLRQAPTRRGGKGPGKGSGRKKPPARRAPNRNGRVPFWKRRSVWLWLLSLCFTGLILVGGVIVYFAQDLPDIRTLNTIEKKPGITMKTTDGLILASYGDVYGDYIPYNAMPQHLVHAVLATEDRRFFEHMGIDPIGILRAMVVNMRKGGFVQGGSTITQQVAKNVFLTPERTLDRKIQEMLLAFWLEGRFSKEEILAIYMNRVYLGAGNYGIDAASRRYFNKSATQVNLIESAILAGLLKAPSKFSPIANPERAKGRAHQVLLNMQDAGYITEQEMNLALQNFQPPKLYREGDPSGSRYFTDWLMDELPQYLGNIDQDLVVITTLDPDYQKEAEDAVNKILNEMGGEKKVSQGALVAMTPDGAVKALVGGRSYSESQFNRAVQAKRQPGSIFKLFVYLAALDSGMSSQMLVNDQPLYIKVGNQTWSPTNFSGDYRGEITMTEALTHSINTVAVQLSQAVGLSRVVDMADRLGIKGVKPTPSIALGAAEATLLELTTAFAHLPNGGKRVEPYGIEAIYSQGGDALYKREGSGLWVVLRQSVVEQMNYMLSQVPRSGTGTRAALPRQMAGKTGTSSDFKDAWFIGFTGQLVTGVWVGNDDNSQMAKVTGGNMPAMIWKGFMEKALEGEPEVAFPSKAQGADVRLPWLAPERLEDHGSGGQEAAPAPAQENGPALNESFWDKLMGGSSEVEHEYPAGSRERRLQ